MDPSTTDAARNILSHGEAVPLAPASLLRAGPLALAYAAGELRQVALGAHVVWRRIYAAVRDANWNTIPGVIGDERIDAAGDRFRVSFVSTHQRNDIHFVWRGEITGAPDGAVRFEYPTPIGS